MKQPKLPVKVGDIYWKNGVRFAVISLTKINATVSRSNSVYLDQVPIEHLKTCTMYKKEILD